MSRIGKQPISIPNGVTIELQDNNLVIVKGSKGELKRNIHPNMVIEINDNVLTVSIKNETKMNRSLHGLSRTLIANMVEGVSNGFQKKLEIVGVGYRAQAAKNKITLNIGYSHPVEFIADNDIEFKMDEEQKNLIIVSGISKEKVGEAAAKVRSFRKPEPYKGKGIKYVGERIIRKAGKTSAK